MTDIAIKVENLSKQYRLGLVGTGTLSHDLNRWWHSVRGLPDPYLKVGESNDRSKKGESDYVWALRDIDFEIKQGEVVGIIGKNGAGKSTLLKILSRVTSPTTGFVKAKGRIASLLEVGTGFHPELTGRENIYLNGTILGMRKAEVTRKLEEIVEFSGVARYIDTPVKRYSSGMTVRLGFAVAAHLEPEILIVDEVLAVGDAEFQKKAIGKMQEVSQGGGRTVLFVSHNMAAVRSLCKKGIVMRNGQVALYSEIDTAINYYISYGEDLKAGLRPHNYFNTENLNQSMSYAKISSIDGIIEYIDDIVIEVGINNAGKNFKDLVLGVLLYDSLGNLLCVSTTDEEPNFTLEKVVSIVIPGNIWKPGKYSISLSLRTKDDLLHKADNALSFSIQDTITYRGLKNKYRTSSLTAPIILFKTSSI